MEKTDHSKTRHSQRLARFSNLGVTGLRLSFDSASLPRTTKEIYRRSPFRFEKIEEPGFFYFIDEKGVIVTAKEDYQLLNIHLFKAVGNYFKTEQEAEAHLKWLEARAVLIEDTKGFKPDWNNSTQPKWYVEYDHEYFDFNVGFRTVRNTGEIYFATEEDAENSIENHEKEWKIYFGIEY